MNDLSKMWTNCIRRDNLKKYRTEKFHFHLVPYVSLIPGGGIVSVDQGGMI